MRPLHFDRLRQMSRQEWQWRTSDAVHRVVERARRRAGVPRWNRGDMPALLTDVVLARCADEITQGDWIGVHRSLAAQITARRARFPLDPASAPALRDLVLARWPDARQDAADRADRLLHGRYDFLGYRDIQCARNGRLDWHWDPIHDRRAPRVFYADVPFLDPDIGDHKVIWELNRHQHWLQLGRAAWLTGDVRYARAIPAQLVDWLDQNPPLIGINWASMLEIGFRAISWTGALHFLLGMERFGSWELEVGGSRWPWLVDMLVALDRQLTHVERHLSYYFSPNTHLTGEALALYVVGTALPELASSRRWAATGRSVLLAEIDTQILGDGGHVERSTHYQRYTLDFYLLATLTARLAGDPISARRFEEAAGRLADFTAAMADANGRLPRIGDDDGGLLWPIAGRACDDVRDSLALAAVVLGRRELAAWGIPEEVAWIAGPDVARFQHSGTTVLLDRRTLGGGGSRLLADAGYFVARGRDGSHAVLDAGLHGYRNGGHAHADALSFTLSIEGQPLLIDPGTSTYTMDSQLRDRMRSSASHNTVTLDGRSQSVPDGPFHWRSTVDARVIAWRTNDAFDWVEATHNGYAPARHRRTVIRTPDSGWLIVDAIDSEDSHSAAAHWHFDPAWHVLADGTRVHAVHPDGQTAWMLCAGGAVSHTRGDAAHDAGWCAPVYGQLVPTSTIRLATDAHAPFALVTWVGSGRLFTAPQIRRIDRSEDDAVIVELIDGPRTMVFMVRPVDSSRRSHVCRSGAFETDAAMLHYSTEDGDLRHLIAQGTAGCPLVRINGRDLPLSAKSTTDALLIHGSDWLSFSARKPVPSAIEKCGAAFARH